MKHHTLPKTAPLAGTPCPKAPKQPKAADSPNSPLAPGIPAEADIPAEPDIPAAAHLLTGSTSGANAPPMVLIGLGMGDMPLCSEAARHIRQAQVLALPRRFLARYSRHRAIKVALTAPLESALRTLEAYQAQGLRCVVLADGDPLLFGIGATLSKRAQSKPHKSPLRILPGVSAMQTACARLGLPWHTVRTVSLHGRHDWLPLAHAALSGNPVCLYTDAAHSPAHIARFLLERGADWFHMVVAARLGSPTESLLFLPLPKAATQYFDGGETVLLLPPESMPTLHPGFLRALSPKALAEHGSDPFFGPSSGQGALRRRGPYLGLDESSLMLDKCLYTKAPVRAAALSLLALSPTDTVWDIGAGSACLSLEAAALVPQGRVYAVEQKPHRIRCIEENRRRVGVPHLEIVQAVVPEGLDALPTPNAIFLGGGLGSAYDHQSPAQASSPSSVHASLPCDALLDTLLARLAPDGRLVAACTLLSSLNALSSYTESRGLPCSVSLIQASSSAPLASSLTLKAMNPIFLVCIQKNADQAAAVSGAIPL